MLSEEETVQLKKEIINHIESTFPAEKIESARSQIESMNSEQLEDFLAKNNLVKNQEGNPKNQCVFCSIVSDSIKSCRLDENNKAIAVLEINPVSRGHALIISKEHSEKLLQGKALSLAKKIVRRIKTKLKPKDIQILNSNLFGHSIINIIPVYKDESISSKRSQTTMEELETLRTELEKKSTKKIKKPKIQQIKERLWLPKRIP